MIGFITEATNSSNGLLIQWIPLPVDELENAIHKESTSFVADEEHASLVLYETTTDYGNPCSGK